MRSIVFRVTQQVGNSVYRRELGWFTYSDIQGVPDEKVFWV
jgi:hypothetical protein